MAYHALHADTHTIFGFFDDPGDPVPRHAHDRGHELGVKKGRVAYRMWDCTDETKEQRGELAAGESVMVPAEWKHEIVALEPRTESYCAFERFDADGKPYLDPSGSHRLEAEGKPWR